MGIRSFSRLRNSLVWALLIVSIGTSSHAGDPHDHEHGGDTSVHSGNPAVAALFTEALAAAAFLQTTMGHTVRHQGTEEVGGHTHFDLVAPGLDGQEVIYDICPHPEMGHHAVMHFAEKRPEWIRPIDGYPGFHEYRSFVPRMITEVHADGQVRPYHGNLVARLDDVLSQGWASRTIAVGIMERLIAEARQHGFESVSAPNTTKASGKS